MDDVAGHEPHIVSRIPTRRAALGAALLPLGVLAGCGTTFPRDAQGTLRRARDGVLNVGISENAPWTSVSLNRTVGGSEAVLIENFASTINAEISWFPGSESVLADAMDSNSLDLVIAGLTTDHPWSDRIASTRPYAITHDRDGRRQERVIGVRPGENALQMELERFLATTAGEL